MLKNYLTIALRNLIRGKLYSVINITGLAIGLSCFFLIVLFVQDEWSYDRFHTKADRIYRVIGILDLEGQGEQSSSCPFPAAPALMNDYPDMIEQVVRFFNFQDPQHTLKVGDVKINESRIFVADSNVFSVFDFPLLKGERAKVLAEPNTIVITQQLARKYFGKEDPVGKVIKFDGSADLRVTGLLGDIPAQSHIHFDGLVSFSSMRTMMPHQLKNWVWNPNWTYVLLKDGVQPAQLEQQFPGFVQKYYPDFLKPQVQHLLQPLTAIHLHSKYEYEIEPNSDISSVYIFSIIGIFILLIACINFMNLATARSANRAKEAGIRKVAGAHKSQLIRQFLTESVLLALIATFISLLLVELLLPFFNHISGKTISFLWFSHTGIYVVLIAGIITGLLSGLYPAFYLSAFEPVNVLKGSLSSASRNTGLRKILVVFQFAVSVMLIVGTGMVYLQLKYLRSASLGFDKDQVLMLPVRPPMGRMFDPFIEELKGLKNVEHVTRMNDVIGKHHNTHEYNYAGMQPGKWIYYPSLLVDEEFIPAMNIRLLAGRNFSKAFPRDDSLAVIINESMVRHLGWRDNESAIGQQFYTPSGREKVIGVVKDFNYEPLHDARGPFVLDLPHPKHKIFWTRYIAVKIKPGAAVQTIAGIEQIWNTYSQEYPYEYFFLDDDLNKQYRSQENLGKLVAGFSALAMIIACLGLFALASFSAEQRTKEIGIRKVMGASVSNIALLLSSDFLKLVLFANLISWPVSWYIVNEWLKGFAYRTDFNWMLLLLAALLTISIALITVIFQSVRAAISNPVKSLKYE